METLHAFAGLERRLLDRLSTRVVPFRGGTAYLDAENPARYVSNFLLAHRNLEAVSTEDLLGAAEAILGGAGYGHRRIVVRGADAGGRLGPAFAAEGFELAREVPMVHRRAPDRAGEREVEEVAFDEARTLIERTYREDPDLSEDTVRLFAQQHRKFELVIGARFFIARVDGEPAGHCELYVDGSDAQVGYVATLDRFRNRGVGRSVVLRALDAASRAGAARTFIVADDANWPKMFYERLGFDPIGVDAVFTRTSTRSLSSSASID